MLMMVLTNSQSTRSLIASKFQSFTDAPLPYRLYIPEDYDSSKSYPLVLFLHGGGERGNDNEIHLMANDGALVWASPEVQESNPAFVLAPQSRNADNGGFAITRNPNTGEINLTHVFEVSKDLQAAYDILQLVINQYNIDQNRLYCTGLSQGGFGTYNLNVLHPDLFAAMVPICGGGDPEKAQILAEKPIWNFHAEDDSIIPVSYSRDTIDSIKKAGGSPIYTEYPAHHGYNHGSWIPAYQNMEMIEWMFQHKKK